MVENKIQHIGMILDGNRRFARRLMAKPWKGHEWGSKKVREFLRWCRDAKIKRATLYSFSVQNFSRPKIEFQYLMKMFEKEFLDIADNKEHDAHKYNVRIKTIGRIWMLPEFVQKAIKKAEKATEKYSDFFLNIAIAYGGQEEIADGVAIIAQKIMEGKLKPSEIDINLIKNHLYSNEPYPDLIIRTGGEKRLSNFLLWQSAYSELAFTEKVWPELTKEDFKKIVDDFNKRDRRFGS